MGILFVGLGVIAAVAGLIMVASGIPVREFSFGNTLIVAGTTAAVGGLVVAGIGVAIMQLRRIADAMQSRPAIRPAELPEMPQIGGRANVPPARVAFPPKSKSEPAERGFEPPSFAAESEARPPFSPIMREELAVPPELDDVPPAPPPRPQAFQPKGPLPRALPPEDIEPKFNPFAEPIVPPAPPPAATKQAPNEPGWRPQQRPPQNKGFDSMWSNEPARPPRAGPPGPPPRVDAPLAPDARSADPVIPRSEPRAAAILKSGVVDGMGYTLYVDGSIEAELPQGTVRFPSIADLRTHLEKNS